MSRPSAARSATADLQAHDSRGRCSAHLNRSLIEGVPVPVFSVAKTIADSFRHRRKVGLSVAIEGLQEALRQKKASPAEISIAAEHGDVATVIRPYLEALTANP